MSKSKPETPYSYLEYLALQDLAARVLADPSSPETHVEGARTRLLSRHSSEDELVAELMDGATAGWMTDMLRVLERRPRLGLQAPKAADPIDPAEQIS